VVVTDNGGSVISQTEDVYASGYLMPAEYGSPTPRVVRDAEGRPMHAVRIWSDPFLSRDDSTSEAYRNSPDSNLRGGRLMESDLQVLGDVLTTSPNPNFRRWASDQLGLDAAQRPTPYALDDPLEQMIYNLDYEDEHDFYSTFTMGRININTASEEVLTALFRRIIKTRAYEYDQTVNGENVRIMRWPEDDEYLTEAEARNLARRVIEYRTAYYDLYKPDGVPSGTGQEFGYHRSSPASGGHPHLTDFRVDHLPVIGPWDGTNPHEYAVTDREASLQACDDEIANSWDHMAATYYNFDPSNNSYMFYAPSDVAMVREPYSFVVTLVAPGLPGFTPQQIFSMSEVPSNYAKYLNDVGANQFWSNDRGSAWNSNWVGTDLQNLYPDNGGSNYSSWSFDARNYFNYESGTVSIDFDLLDPSNPNITYAQPAGGMDPVEEARNRIAVFEHNDSSGLDMTAHTYIANPPFRHIFDLFKVIDSGEDPHALPIEEDPASGNYQLELITSGDETGMTDGTQVYSGPSAFRYEARWDTTTSEFITIANYLDDIAPFITCRSYVFRVEAVGAVPASGGAAGAVIDTARISRDRAKSAIVDVGPLWSRRSSDGASEVAESLGLTAPDRQRSFHILWFKDE